MAKNYKEIRNEFMHSNGTTPYETLLAIFPSFIYKFIGSTVSSLLLSFVTQNKACLFTVEYITTVVLTVLHITILSDYMNELLITSITVIISLILFINQFNDIKGQPKTSELQRKPFVTNYRAAVSLSTVIAILAVDFRIFPRRFAKTETFGFSLMDVGVGLYMFANGMVAPELRGQHDSFKKTVKSTIPLLVLGGVRFFVTKQSDYAVPVSEYGVHWNFFITLAVTKLFTSLILNVINVRYIIINAVALLVAHEVLLQSGMENFVIKNKKRDNFITANREGLVSSLGYISLYLFSVYFGYLLDVRKGDTDKKKKLTKMFGLSFVLFAFTMILHNYFGISRRLANSAYCFWMLFISMFMTSLFFVGEIVQETVFKRKLTNCVYSPYIFQAINYNALPFFLLSNISTGVVNLCINTLEVNPVPSLLIICMYMLVNCTVVCVLYEKRIKLKL